MSASSNGKAVILMDGGYVENVSDVAEHHHGPEMDIEALSSKLVDEFDVDHQVLPLLPVSGPGPY